MWTKSQVEATGDEVLPPVKAEVAGSSPVRTASGTSSAHTDVHARAGGSDWRGVDDEDAERMSRGVGVDP